LGLHPSSALPVKRRVKGRGGGGGGLVFDPAGYWIPDQVRDDGQSVGWGASPVGTGLAERVGLARGLDQVGQQAERTRGEFVELVVQHEARVGVAAFADFR